MIFALHRLLYGPAQSGLAHALREHADEIIAILHIFREIVHRDFHLRLPVQFQAHCVIQVHVFSLFFCDTELELTRTLHICHQDRCSVRCPASDLYLDL